MWINEQKKENNMIRRSVDYRQDLTNQIRLCKFLVGDTPNSTIPLLYLILYSTKLLLYYSSTLLNTLFYLIITLLFLYST